MLSNSLAHASGQYQTDHPHQPEASARENAIELPRSRFGSVSDRPSTPTRSVSEGKCYRTPSLTLRVSVKQTIHTNPKRQRGPFGIYVPSLTLRSVSNRPSTPTRSVSEGHSGSTFP